MDVRAVRCLRLRTLCQCERSAQDSECKCDGERVRRSTEVFRSAPIIGLLSSVAVNRDRLSRTRLADNADGR